VKVLATRADDPDTGGLVNLTGADRADHD
jgi:hypothetical protein